MTPLTPVSWQHSSPPRSEAATLRAGMWFLIAWGALLVVAIVALVTALGDPAAGQIAVVSLAGALALAGVLKRGSPWASWASLVAIAAVVLMGMASPDTRVDLLVMGTYTVTFLAVLITSRPWGLAWIGIGTIAMVVVVTRSDLVVEVGALSINVGSIAVVQMVVAGTWLWWAWHSALDQATRRDVRAAEQEQVIVESIALQERTRAWRDAITRTHETILNDLRYVLRSPELDRDRLREQLLTTRDRRAQPPRGEVPSPDAIGLDRLAHRLRSEFSGSLEFRDSSAGSRGAHGADVEPILIEIVRNISRHADARRIEITIEDVSRGCRITVEDDGTSPGIADTSPGIGRSVVVGEALEALGARLEESSHRVVISIPEDGRSRSTAGIALPLLVSVILVGSALGGSVQFLLLLAGSSLSYLPAAMAACLITAVGVATVLRSRRVGMEVLVPSAVIAAVVPWGLVAAEPVCADPALVLTTINLSLNAFFAILLWARNRWAWLLVTPALAGVLALDLLPGVGCPIQGIDVLLSSAILIPAALTLSWLSARSTARWEAQDRQRWETEITEVARADADLDLARLLGTSIDEAWAQMWDIAEGTELDDTRRRRLRTVESSIRASLQADPLTSGGFVLAARHIVTAAAAEGVPVHVRALRGSADPRPLDAGLVVALTRMTIAGLDSGTSVHVFFDGREDYLALTVPAAVAARAGFVAGWAESFDDCHVEVEYVADEVGADAEVTVMVSRPSSVADGVPAVVG